MGRIFQILKLEAVAKCVALSAWSVLDLQFSKKVLTEYGHIELMDDKNQQQIHISPVI